MIRVIQLVELQFLDQKLNSHHTKILVERKFCARKGCCSTYLSRCWFVSGIFPDLLATSGDYLRVWRAGEPDTRLECLLNNNKNSDFCAPLTSFDWNEVSSFNVTPPSTYLPWRSTCLRAVYPMNILIFPCRLIQIFWALLQLTLLAQFGPWRLGRQLEG